MIANQFKFNALNQTILKWSFEELSYTHSEQTDSCSFDQPILMLFDQQQSHTKNMETFEQNQAHKSKKIRQRKNGMKTKRRKRRIQKNKEQNQIVGPFSYQEDQRILNLILEHGPRFQIIHSFFSERSQNALKNRYYKFLRYRWDQVLGIDYQHLNHISDEFEVEKNQNFNSHIENMNLFPEVSNILKNLIKNIQQHFS